jgi:chromosome segregation ATPase
MESNLKLANMVDALQRDKLELHNLFMAAEDAGGEARAEVTRLKDELAEQRDRNGELDKEVRELNDRLVAVVGFNTTAIQRCAQKQRTIEQLRQCNVSREEVNKLKDSLREAGLKLVELAKTA